MDHLRVVRRPEDEPGHVDHCQGETQPGLTRSQCALWLRPLNYKLSYREYCSWSTFIFLEDNGWLTGMENYSGCQKFAQNVT